MQHSKRNLCPTANFPFRFISVFHTGFIYAFKVFVLTYLLRDCVFCCISGATMSHLEQSQAAITSNITLNRRAQSMPLYAVAFNCRVRA